MNKHRNNPLPSFQNLTAADPQLWILYWKAHGQPWRIEPEISADRQEYLAKRLAIQPNIETSSYPFKNISLNRADVEWLLANHGNGQGPVNWSIRGLPERGDWIFVVLIYEE